MSRRQPTFENMVPTQKMLKAKLKPFKADRDYCYTLSLLNCSNQRNGKIRNALCTNDKSNASES